MRYDLRNAALLSGAILIVLTASLSGATITVGQVQLLPNQADQWIDIQVTGGDPVAGVDLFLQVGDGGPELATFGLPASKAGPKISGVELKAGTIFQNVTDLPANVGSAQLPQTAVHTLALVGTTASVPAAGTLAKVQIDTTGFFGGSWALRLDNVLPFAVFGGPHATNFAGTPAVIENGSITIPITRGDYNDNQQFDPADVNALAAALRGGSNDRARYDLNNDNVVNWDDYHFWVQSYARVYFGDANFDGRFDSSDLVEVFAAGKYEDGADGNATWSEGDWNGDGDFGTGDLVLAFQEGGYEIGIHPATPATRSVPEPGALTGLAVAAIALVGRWRRGSASR
jgi:hypothetical protein